MMNIINNNYFSIFIILSQSFKSIPRNMDIIFVKRVHISLKYMSQKRSYLKPVTFKKCNTGFNYAKYIIVCHINISLSLN